MADPRANELARITDAIAKGEGAAFVIVGDAGIGKTTLLSAVAREARARGVAVLSTRWSEDAGAPPMWPWSRLVRDFVAAHGAAALAEVHPLVRRLAEDVAEAAGLPLPEPAADELAGRYATGDGVGRLLGRATPVVVLLEDLHHGSPASVAPLESFAAAATGMGAVIVATTRHAAAASGLTAVGAARVTLETLDKDEAVALVRDVAPALSDEAVRDVVTRAAGNPFFITELARLSATGSSRETTTEGVREVVLQRVDHLGDEAREVLSLAALLGPSPAVRRLDGLVGDEDLVASIVDGAHRTRLLEVHGDTFTWAHDLVREALVDALGPSDRRRLHRRIAAALAASASTHPFEFAHHLLASGARTSDAADAGEAAARHAVAMGAYEDAVEWAVKTQSFVDELDDAVTRNARIDALAGRALIGLSEYGAGKERLVRAAKASLRAGDPDQAAVALLDVGAERLRWEEEFEPPVDLMHRAIAEVRDEVLRCRLQSRLSDLARDYATQKVLTIEALAAARACGDPDVVISAIGRHILNDLSLPLEEQQALLDEVRVLAAASGGERQFEADAFNVVLHLERGQLDDAAKLIPSTHAAIMRLGLPQALSFDTTEAMIHLLQGRLDAADEHLTRLIAATEGPQVGNLMAIQAVNNAMVSIIQGDFTDFLPTLDMFLSMTAGSPFAVRVHCLAALVGVLADNRARAEESLDEVFRFGLDQLDAFGFGQADFLRQITLEAACLLGRDDAVRALEPYLDPFAGRMPVAGMAPVFAFGSADHQLAMASRLRGDADEARLRIDRAVALHRKMGSGPWTARSLLVSAEVAGDAGDTERAELDAREAAKLASRHHMRAVGETAAAILSSLGAAPVKGASVGGPAKAIVFTDIESSTSSAAALGDDAWLVRLREHDSVVRKLVAQRGGREIKHLGDGFMLTFPTAAAAVDFGVALQRAFTDALVRVRAGIHVGPVVEEDGDVFGTTVNVAARVASAALGGETVVSDAVLNLVTDARVGTARTVDLKGVPDPMRLFPLDVSLGSSDAFAFD